MSAELVSSLAALSGTQKAVLLLLSLEESLAAPIVAELNAEEIQSLRDVAASMQEVPSAALDEVYFEFLNSSKDRVALPKGAPAYIRQLAARSHGEVKTAEIFADAPPTALSRVIAADPPALAGLLETEHPQVVAALLSQLPAANAARVLELLPEEMRSTVLQRLGLLTEVPGSLLEEVAYAIMMELPESGGSGFIPVDGVSSTAALVKNLGKETCEIILGDIESEDERLAAEIRKAMYTFEDLAALDPKSMRELLKAVPGDRLTLALKTASDKLKDLLFGGMSKRAADRLKEDLIIMGAVRLAEVEEAQREIVDTALRLEAEGTLSLGNNVEQLV